jgi:TatD DNase family protein
MTMTWFDTHIHLLAPEWTSSPLPLYQQALSGQINEMLMPGVRATDWDYLLQFAKDCQGVYFAPGLHPFYAEQWNDAVAQRLIAMSAENKVVALGEIGLDVVAGPSLEIQEEVFRAQLQIALDARLPVLLHARKMTGRVLTILRELKIGQKTGGIWHGFSGSIETAEELIDLGFKIGVGPILLRESARKLPQVVVAVPAQALVLETDAPDMIDRPSGLLEVATRLAQLRGWAM